MPSPRLEIGGDADAAGALDRGDDSAADGAGRAGHENDFILEIGHGASYSLPGRPAPTIFVTSGALRILARMGTENSNGRHAAIPT